MLSFWSSAACQVGTVALDRSQHITVALASASALLICAGSLLRLLANPASSRLNIASSIIGDDISIISIQSISSASVGVDQSGRTHRSQVLKRQQVSSAPSQLKPNIVIAVSCTTSRSRSTNEGAPRVTSRSFACRAMQRRIARRERPAAIPNMLQHRCPRQRQGAAITNMLQHRPVSSPATGRGNNKHAATSLGVIASNRARQ